MSPVRSTDNSDNPDEDTKKEIVDEWTAELEEAKKELKEALGKNAEEMKRLGEELRASAMKYDAVLQKVELERSRRQDQHSSNPNTRDL